MARPIEQELRHGRKRVPTPVRNEWAPSARRERGESLDANETRRDWNVVCKTLPRRLACF